MASKRYQADSDSDMEDGGAKLNMPIDEVVTPTDAMEVDSTPAPATDRKKAAAEARAERAARRKQRKEELAAQGLSKTSSLASTPNPESEPASPTKTERKPRKKKTEKKSSSTKPEKAEAGTEVPTEPAAAPEASAPAPAGDAKPLPFVIDVKPTKARVEVADTETISTPASEKGTSVAPSSVNGDGLNRAARRRLMQIDRQRLAIKKELNIAADSDERQAEVEQLLAAWTAQFDEKAANRLAKKRAKKDSAKGKSKGKLLTGRNNYEKQKQIKKQKRKEALRLRQEAGSGRS